MIKPEGDVHDHIGRKVIITDHHLIETLVVCDDEFFNPESPYYQICENNSKYDHFNPEGARGEIVIIHEGQPVVQLSCGSRIFVEWDEITEVSPLTQLAEIAE